MSTINNSDISTGFTGQWLSLSYLGLKRAVFQWIHSQRWMFPMGRAWWNDHLSLFHSVIPWRVIHPSIYPSNPPSIHPPIRTHTYVHSTPPSIILFFIFLPTILLISSFISHLYHWYKSMVNLKWSKLRFGLFYVLIIHSCHLKFMSEPENHLQLFILYRHKRTKIWFIGGSGLT